MNRLKNLKIGTIIFLFGMMNLLSMSVVIGIGLKQITIIGNEAKTMAETDLPLIVLLGNISSYQMGQSLHIERAIKWGKLMAQDKTVKDYFEKETMAAKKLAKIVFQTIDNGTKLLASIDKENELARGQKYVKTDYLLRSLHKDQARYNFLAERVFNLLSQTKFQEAETTFEELNMQDEKIDNILNDFILNMEILTHESVLQTKKNKKDAIATMLLFSIIILVVTVWLGFVISRTIKKPILELTEATKLIADGNLKSTIVIRANNEIGSLASSFTKMTENLKRSSEDNAASKEELKQRAEELSKSNRSLQNMAKIKTSIAQLSDKMRGELEPEQLGKNILAYLAPYLDAQIGTFYVANGENSMRLISSYAHAKNIAREIKFGEGLVGQAAERKKTVLMNDLPGDYFKINSGLGETKPRNIILAPILYEEQVNGILELGSINNFSDSQVNFLEAINENIGISLNGALARMKTKELLEESQQQAEELQTQQEELRTANEELEEKARASKESDR